VVLSTTTMMKMMMIPPASACEFLLFQATDLAKLWVGYMKGAKGCGVLTTPTTCRGWTGCDSWMAAPVTCIRYQRIRLLDLSWSGWCCTLTKQQADARVERWKGRYKGHVSSD
jgi:hypothetical protein